MAERTGCPVLTSLWSYVLEEVALVSQNCRTNGAITTKSNLDDNKMYHSSMAERTGCSVLTSLWSYVLEDVTLVSLNAKLVARTPPKSTRKMAKWITKAKNIQQ